MKTQAYSETPQLDLRRNLPILLQREFLTLQPSWKAILVYTALVFWVGDVSLRSLGVSKLSELVNVSEDTFRAGLLELQKKKIVRIKRTKSKKNGKLHQLPNVYVLLDLTPPKLPI